MILRRLAHSLKQQNWTAIGIEFVLLVSGVFLGIQVQQWNNDRIERKLEHVYLERILSDINISIETNELNVQRLTSYSDGQALVVNSLRRCDLLQEKKDAFADALSDIGKVGPSVFVLSTVDEMLSAGKFSIIRNSKLRDTLNGLSRDAKYQNNIFNAIDSQLAPAIGYTNNRVIWIYQDYKTPFDSVAWADAEIDFNALCKDKEYQAAISTVRYLTNAGISLNSRALASLRSAKVALEAELGRSSNTKDAAP